MEKNELTVQVTRAQAGDQGALNVLYNEYYNSVYYFALKMTKDESIAADITQDTFIQVITNIKVLRDPALFGSWLRSITYHRCTCYFKKSKDVLVDEENEEIFEEIHEDKAEFIPDEALDKAEFRKTVMEIIDSLPDEQRASVLMYYFDEMSIKQIAAIQGVSEGTVKSRLNYARKYIKAAVESYENKHGIKLHGALIPILYWIFSTEISLIPASTAVGTASGIAAATGIGLNVSGGTQVASATGTGMQSTATNSSAKAAAQKAARVTSKKASEKAAVEAARASVGTTAKAAAGKAVTGVAAKAGMSLGAKIVAVVAAVAVTAGAAVGAVAIVKNKNNDKLPEDTENVAVTTRKEETEPESESETEFGLEVNPEFEAEDPLYTRSEQIDMYNAYLTGGGYEYIYTNSEPWAMYAAEMDNFAITSHLIDIDNDGIYEAYLYFIDDLYQSLTVFLDITDDEVVCVKSAYYGGGTGGGGNLYIANDTENGNTVLLYKEYVSGGWAERYSNMYVYSGTEHEVLAKISQTRYVGVDELINEVKNETDLYRMDGDQFFFYKIDDEYVSYEEYTDMSERFVTEDEIEMLPGTYEIPIPGGSSNVSGNITEEPEEVAITDEARTEQIRMYNEYLANDRYKEFMSANELKEFTDYYNESEPQVHSCLMNYDNDDIYEALVKIHIGYNPNIYAYLDIIDGEVVCVRSIYSDRFGVDGGFIAIGTDKETDENVLVLFDEYKLGMSEHYSGTGIYSIEDNSEIVRYEITEYLSSYDSDTDAVIKQILKETDLFEIDETGYLSCTKINGEYVSNEEYRALNERYEITRYHDEDMIEGTMEAPIVE